MLSHTRRDIMRGLALAGGTLAAGGALAAPAMLKLDEIKKEAKAACLYHCDFGDANRYSQMLRNISNHYSVYNADPFEIELAIVAHGPGVKFFLSTLNKTPWAGDKIPNDLIERVQSLSKNGLRVFLCDITFANLKLDRQAIRQAEFIHMVPSGVATVAALQAKGFAYLKVG